MAQELQDDSMLVELDQQYKELVSQIVQKLNALKAVSSKQMNDVIKEIQNQLKQCGMTIREMKLEIKVLDNKMNWTKIVNAHQSEYQALKVKFEKAKETAQRKDICYSQNVKSQQILQQTKQNTNALKDAQKELHQVDLNAVDVMNTLDEQTQQINKIKTNVTESNKLLDDMGKTIKKMSRRWWA
mmetsp:Transcript_63240/g.100548  ORF Transcript_63240/g.100548 Transcript_63240/m.100548 type:complete len:185 (+) Transcript_63240:818-1372(+)